MRLQLPDSTASTPLFSALAHGASIDPLRHRRPQLIWASGESFSGDRLTLGAELLRHGLKEWGGIKDMLTIGHVGAGGALSDASVDALWAAVDAASDCAELPIVVCRDPLAATLLVERVAAAQNTLLGLVGSPLAQGWRVKSSCLFDWSSPIPLPHGLSSSDVAWLGAPDEVCAPQALRNTPPFVNSLRGLSADSIPLYLHALELHTRRRHATALWLVVFVDRLRLGRGGAEFFDDEVLACVLRWMQGQPALEVGVVLLSDSLMPTSLRPRVADAARHLGQALFRPRPSQRLSAHAAWLFPPKDDPR